MVKLTIQCVKNIAINGSLAKLSVECSRDLGDGNPGTEDKPCGCCQVSDNVTARFVQIELRNEGGIEIDRPNRMNFFTGFGLH